MLYSIDNERSAFNDKKVWSVLNYSDRRAFLHATQISNDEFSSASHWNWQMGWTEEFILALARIASCGEFPWRCVQKEKSREDISHRSLFPIDRATIEFLLSHCFCKASFFSVRTAGLHCHAVYSRLRQCSPRIRNETATNTKCPRRDINGSLKIQFISRSDEWAGRDEAQFVWHIAIRIRGNETKEGGSLIA